MKIFSIFDRAAHLYGGLIVNNNDELCKRNIKMALQANALDKQMLAFPDEFELYCFGEFDPETGNLAPIAPEFVIRLSDLLPEVNKNG